MTSELHGLLLSEHYHWLLLMESPGSAPSGLQALMRGGFGMKRGYAFLEKGQINGSHAC